MRGRLGKEEDGEKMGRRWVLRQEESERERWGRRIMCTVCLVWLRSSWPDGFHEQDLTPDWSVFCRHITSSSAPLLPSYHPSIQHLILPVCQIPQFPNDLQLQLLILCHLKHSVSLSIVVINWQPFKLCTHVLLQTLRVGISSKSSFFWRC